MDAVGNEGEDADITDGPAVSKVTFQSKLQHLIAPNLLATVHSLNNTMLDSTVREIHHYIHHTIITTHTIPPHSCAAVVSAGVRQGRAQEVSGSSDSDGSSEPSINRGPLGHNVAILHLHLLQGML